MVVQHFLKWMKTARVGERAAAASALARAYVNGQLEFDDRCAAEAALTLLLEDPSPKVRLALAEALSMSRHAPIQIVSALSADQPEVAAMVLARSPLLTDIDLVDRVAVGDATIQTLVAMRPGLSMAVSAAIAEIGEPEACLELLENPGAAVAVMSLRRLTERHCGDARVRERLLADPRLPADCRHLLLNALGEVLGQSRFVVAMIGRERAKRVMRDACVKASVTLIERTEPEEHEALVEHLRIRGELTESFLVRIVAFGKVDFLGAALVAISGQSPARVASLLAGGRDVAVRALLSSSGISRDSQNVILRALKVWREVANGRRVAGVQEISWLMLHEIDATPGQAGPSEQVRELAAMLRSIHLDELRDNARGHALAIAAA